jgi:hypothetical protein
VAACAFAALPRHESAAVSWAQTSCPSHREFHIAWKTDGPKSLPSPRPSLTASQVAATDVGGPSSVPDFNVTLATPISGGTLTITWSSGTLLEATNVIGPWSPVGGAAPPSYSVPTSGAPMKFYRVQVQ